MDRANETGVLDFSSEMKKRIVKVVGTYLDALKGERQISISGHQLDATNALKSYVTEKLDRIERHAEHITKVEITSR